MADEENKIPEEETTPATEAGAAPEAASDEAPGAAPAAEETPAAEPEAAAEEAPPAAAAPAAEESPPAAAAPAAEPEVQLPPKERRQARRSAAVAKRGARRARTPEERAAERKRKADERRRYRAKLKERRAARPKTEPPTAEPEEPGTGHRKVRQGVVVSDKADKTIVVRIDVTRHHRRYHKTIRSSTTFHAHDEANDARTGDTVRIVEARPLSRLKRWRLVEVLERAK